MWESFFIRVFFVLSWISCTLLPVQCQSPSGIPNASKSTGRMELCLGRCSHSFQANDAEIPGEEVPVDHFCYTKCIGKEGKQDFSTNERNRSVNPYNTPSLARTKRGASSSEGNTTSVAVQINSTYNREKNQTSLDTTVVPNTKLIRPTWSGGYEYPEWLLRCLMNKSRVEKSFTTDAVKMAFEELNNTGKYIGTLSWTPFDIQLTNWTGYAIIYVFVDSDDNQSDDLCQELDKNATNFTITNSSYGLTNGSYVALYITSLPYPVDIPLFFSFGCKVPTGCWRYADDESTYSTGGDIKGVPNMAAAISSACTFILLVHLLLSSLSVNFIV